MINRKIKYGISKQWYFFISAIDYSIDKTSDLHVKVGAYSLTYF